MDRLATLEADLRDLADRLLAEREERLAAKPPGASSPEPHEAAAPADPAPADPTQADPTPADPTPADRAAADTAPGDTSADGAPQAGRRRLSGALLLAIFLAPAVIAALAALLFADENGDDGGAPRERARRAVSAPRQAVPPRVSADGAATARALRARGVFGVQAAGRSQALEGLCAGTADVAVLRSVPRGPERAPAAGCDVDVVAQVPVAVTRLVAPLGGCLGAGRALGRIASPGPLDASRRRTAERAGPRALRRLVADAPIRGREATVRRRVARQASVAATVAFDATRRLLPIGIRRTRSGPCVDPRAAEIAAGSYPLTRRLVVAANGARTAPPATLRLAARLRAASPRPRVRTIATIRAPHAR